MPSRVEEGYAGARIVKVKPAGWVLNDVEVESLPVIVPISDDEPSAVAMFYRSELVGRNDGGLYLNQVFWDGGPHRA